MALAEQKICYYFLPEYYNYMAPIPVTLCLDSMINAYK